MGTRFLHLSRSSNRKFQNQIHHQRWLNQQHLQLWLIRMPRRDGYGRSCHARAMLTELFIGEVHSAGVELCGIANAQDVLAFLERRHYLVSASLYLLMVAITSLAG